MTVQVSSSSAVLVHFTLKLADGTTAESTRNNGKPALFRLGDGSLSTPLEQQLIGLCIGDKRTFTLPPEAAFGATNPDLLQFFAPGDFTGMEIPTVGTIMLFTAIDGSEMPGMIREVTPRAITVDFNHPLAGHTVSFDIEIMAINPPLEQPDANLAG